jgi:transcriptional regulator with XRE-family HTH domain
MTNKEKFKNLVSDEKTDTIQRNRTRIKNRARLRESQAIALKVLDKLDELGWSQRKLAQAMDVSPQQITKIVKGKENLTLETQTKLQDILDIPILATYYEKMMKEIFSDTHIQETEKYTIPNNTSFKIDYDLETKEYSHYQQTA